MAWSGSTGQDSLRGVYTGNISAAFPGPFTLFIDFTYTGSDGYLFAARTSGGPLVRVISNKVVVHDWRNAFSGTTTLISGTRYRVFFICDTSLATPTARLWMMPIGGSISLEIDNPSNWYANTSISEYPNRSGWYEPFTINDSAAWSVQLDSSLRFALLSGINPIRIEPENLLWKPGFLGDGDAVGGIVTLSASAEYVRNIASVSGEFVILKDPLSHAPVQYSGKYWGADHASTTNIELWQSTDLITWTYDSEITTAAAESLTEIEPMDFVYDSGAIRPYQILYYGNTVGANSVYSISSAAMSTWVNEPNNPLLSGPINSAYNQGGHPGPEDFRVTKDDNGDWVAVFEHNDVSFGNCIGVAKNTGARLADAFTYMGAPFGDEGGAIAALTYDSSAILANPVIVRHGPADYSIIFEFRAGSSLPSLLAKTTDPGDPKKYRIVGGVINGGEDLSYIRDLIPNCILNDAGILKLYGASGSQCREFSFKNSEQWVGGSITPFVGGFIAGSQAPLLPINLLDSKILIKNSAVNLLDGKVKIQNVSADLFDGLINIQNQGLYLLNSKIVIKDIATNLLDSKCLVKSSDADLFDGKLTVQAATEISNLIDGRVNIDSIGAATDLLYSKINIKDAATNFLDGLIIIQNQDSNLLDSKLVIKNSQELILDSKVTIKDVAEDLLDSKLQIQTQALNLFDGKLDILSATIGVLDGKLVIKDENTILLDGKLSIEVGEVLNLLNGKIIISEVAQGRVKVTFLMQTPSISFEMN